MNPSSVQLAQTDHQIAACLPVLRQSRPHLVDAGEAAVRVRRQQQSGFQLAYVTDDGQVVAVAGFRLLEKLA